MGYLATLDKRRIATVLVVLLIAFLTGHFMQNILSDQNPVATIKDGPDAAPYLRSVDEPKPLPTPPAATLMPILERPPVLPRRVAEPGSHWRDAKGEQTKCRTEINADPSPAATVTVRVGTCPADASVLIRHGPIIAEGRTDAAGNLVMRLPAFEVTAAFTVETNDTQLTVTAKVPEVANYQHAALLWSGAQSLRMHAFEFGARKNQFGHVWSGAPKSPVRAVRGSGGFLTRLGDGSGRSAEVYSFPARQVPLSGVVRLVVEGEVTRENCGREVRATALQPGALGTLGATEVELVMPGCEHLGQIVRLQNLLQDMRLAER